MNDMHIEWATHPHTIIYQHFRVDEYVQKQNKTQKLVSR